MSQIAQRSETASVLLAPASPPSRGREQGRAWRRVTATLLLFSALSAIGGGGELVYFHDGSDFLPPISLLEHTPFADFLIPGLILVLVLGSSSLAASVLVLRRSKWAVDFTLLAGGSLLSWIVAEVAMMRSAYWLHWLYGGLGLAILLLALHAARRSQEPRHRWVVTVTAAEACGFAVPVVAGVLSSKLQLGDLAQAFLLIAAGGLEGLVLGAGQAHAMPIQIDRARFARFTSAGAAGTWALAMLVPTVAGVPSLSLPVQILIAVVCGLLGLASLSGAQALALKPHTPRALIFALWTAAAWVIALPASFGPSPFVDESTPVISLVALFGTAGVLMAYLMAVITWQGARRV